MKDITEKEIKSWLSNPDVKSIKIGWIETDEMVLPTIEIVKFTIEEKESKFKT